MAIKATEIKETSKVTESAPPAQDPALEEVECEFFKDNGKYKDDLTVGVNGRVFKIQRGVRVKIPRYVYEVLVRSMEQDKETASLISSMEDNFVKYGQ